MAISSYKVFLMGMASAPDATTVEWKKLADIKDFPDLGGAPEMLETTTLSDRAHTYIPGIEENEAKTFTLNYDKDVFDFLHGLRGALHGYAVWLGGTEAANGTVTPTGEAGKYAWGGYLDIFANGAGVNEVVNMTVTIAPSTVIGTDGTIAWGPLEDSATAITFPT
jgi:hypothetical protein